MFQVIVKKGKVFTEEVPAPAVGKKQLLIKVKNSCISAGTETTTIKASGKSLFQKAKEKPEKVIKVLNKLKNDGIKSTFSMVQTELGIGTAIGYSNSGVVVEKGEGVDEFEVGDFVAAAGGNFALHAEYVVVPVNLVCKLPETVGFPEASSVALGAIALQGIRRADLKMGEYCCVFGTGILGLLTIQMLKNAGVRVAAVDLDEKRLALAKKYGAEVTFNGTDEIDKLVDQWSGGYGVDSVLFTAATSSSTPLSQAFKMCRRRGRVILVGVSGMTINRADIYQKELDFMISTSYGPGRYDKNYELNGIDYPYAYARWTEKRNMQEYLRLIANKAINFDDIITHTIDIENADIAFEIINDRDQNSLMIILEYPDKEENKGIKRKINIRGNKVDKNKINIGLVGAGSFAKNIHLPNIKKLEAKFNVSAIMNKTGYKAKELANNCKATFITTDYSEIINDPDIDLVLICTRHDSHASLTLQALKKGKNVFVEKPLSTNIDELNAIKEFYKDGIEKKPLLTVGFNRRFSKYLTEIKKHTDKRINPMIINYRMNAGYLPLDHWVHESGGRIVGECCHIIDLVTSLTGARIKTLSVENLTPSNDKISTSDNKTILLKYEDGSVATISYFATGSKKLAKEYMEIHFDEKSIVMDDYKKLSGFGCEINEIKSEQSDKGHLEELIQLYNSLTKPETGWPIEYWDLIQTTEATLII